jgi:hypothetical protein
VRPVRSISSRIDLVFWWLDLSDSRDPRRGPVGRGAPSSTREIRGLFEASSNSNAHPSEPPSSFAHSGFGPLGPLSQGAPRSGCPQAVFETSWARPLNLGRARGNELATVRRMWPLSCGTGTSLLASRSAVNAVTNALAVVKGNGRCRFYPLQERMTGRNYRRHVGNANRSERNYCTSGPTPRGSVAPIRLPPWVFYK